MLIMKGTSHFSLALIASTLLAAAGHAQSAYYPRGQLRLQLSLPYVNHVVARPTAGRVVRDLGFLGERVGLEYSYAGRRALAVEGVLAVAARLPFPVHVDEEGRYAVASTIYVALTHLHLLSGDRVGVGYGLTFGRNTFNEGFRSFTDSLPDVRDSYRRDVLGVVANAYYRLGRTAYLGLVYRPTFLAVTTRGQHSYEHLVSLDLLWRLRLNKRRPLRLDDD